MSENGSNYNKVYTKCKELYDVRLLPGCFVVLSDTGSVVVYQNGDKKSTFTVCKGDKREECMMDTVHDTIARYV